MKKLLSVLGVLLVAALALVSGPARGEVYVEAYLGGNFAANAGMNGTTTHYVDNGAWENHAIPGRIDPSFQGGLKLGYWFVREGFLGYNYPDWAKYFGFYLDFSYHRLNFRRQRMTSVATDNIAFTGTAAIPGSVDNTFFSNGSAATLAFMFVARYGFYPDKDVPFGRLQPYLAVGPAILFSSQKSTINSARYSALIDEFFPYTANLGSKSSADIALAAETGLRWMALKNVSVEVSFKYRWAKPSYSYDYLSIVPETNDAGADRTPKNIKLEPTYHLFSFQVGAAYHF